MLNYHKILGQTAETKTAKFEHFLTLGSHQSTLCADPLRSLSLVTIYPQTRLIITQQPKQQNQITLAIPLSNRIRINQQIYTKHDIVFNIKTIDQIQNLQSIFLYLVVKTDQSTNHLLTSAKLEEKKDIQVGNTLKIKKVILNKGESLQTNKRIIIFVKSGGFTVKNTLETFSKNQCLYSVKGCGFITGSQQSQIILLQIGQKNDSQN